MILRSFFRTLRGERPGMSAGVGRPAAHTFYNPISIQTQVRLADVSYYQGEIDFALMRRVLDGVIIRAGQRNWVDIRFRENWQRARAAGIPRGSYWFYDSREDPRKQAALWWSLIQGDTGELIHVADLEEAYGGAYGLPVHMRIFLEEFQHLSGLPDDRIAVYTGFYWFNVRIGNDLFFRRFALWLAWYAAMSVVRVPAPWIETDLILWQYTSCGDGTLYGVSSLEIDLNWYCCDMATYSRRFNLGAPAPDGGTMYAGKTSTTAKVWNAIGGTQIDELPSNTPVLGYAPVGDYVRLTSPLAGYTKKYWLTGYVEQPAPPPPPPEPEPAPALPDLPVTITLGDDLTYTRQTLTVTLKPK